MTKDILQIIMLPEQLLIEFHTLRVYYAHAAANLNSGYTKYAKVARVHYFCIIALRIPYAQRMVHSRARRIDSFTLRVILFCWYWLKNLLKLCKMSFLSHKKTKMFICVVYELD